jgi:hypothetical protein
MHKLLLLLLVLTLTACGKFSKDEMARQQDAYAGMMEAHDRVMPRMGEMHELEDQLLVFAEDATLNDTLRSQVLAAIENLREADEEMMTWMQAIKPLEQLQAEMDQQAIMSYLAEEDKKIRIVENAMESSISIAQRQLGLLSSNGAPAGQE